MSRKEALEKLKLSSYNPDTIDDEFKYIATKLGISVEELRTFLNFKEILLGL